MVRTAVIEKDEVVCLGCMPLGRACVNSTITVPKLHPSRADI